MRWLLVCRCTTYNVLYSGNQALLIRSGAQIQIGSSTIQVLCGASQCALDSTQL